MVQAVLQNMISEKTWDHLKVKVKITLKYSCNLDLTFIIKSEEVVKYLKM